MEIKLLIPQSRPMTKAVIKENATDTDNTDNKYILYLATKSTYFNVPIAQRDKIILQITNINKVTHNPEIAPFISSLLNAICEDIHVVKNRNSQKCMESKLPFTKIPLYTMIIEFTDHSTK